MADLQAFYRDEHFGYMQVRAKSKEKIRFPVPSELAKPKIFVNSQTTAEIQEKNNLGVQINMGSKKDQACLLIRYEISKQQEHTS